MAGQEREFAEHDRMTNLDMQNLCRMTMGHLTGRIAAGMSLEEVRAVCEEFMLANGADSFWYWDVGAFVFSGDETAVSVSGKAYQTPNRRICKDDIITVDLSPQNRHIWGDFSRTIIVENGKVVDKVEDIRRTEWRRGLQMEARLHRTLLETAEPGLTFEELYRHVNNMILRHGFINVDFLGNLGHSIAENRDNRIYIEKGNTAKLSEVGMFTFEPHISLPGSKYGFKQEDIYYFEHGRLARL